YSGPIYGAQVCIRGGAVLGPAQILPYSPNPLLRNATDRETRWVPCHQLRQCGFPPITNAASFNPAPNISRASSNQTLNMTYGQAGSPLPFGCVLNFEVVAVDSAGNSSVAATPANRRFLEVAPAGVEPQNEVHYATCGASCRFGVSYWYHHFAYIFPLNRFPNGYY
ncbi:MAG TPA: hypothetical protein PKC28_14615, partial [Bdellovibrionales bacterium]|nr:hypothetical protein [Bdellovibrionales bacterium]